MTPAVFIGIIVAVAAGFFGFFLETKRVGGIRFWRLGRLGGSFYISRKPNPVPVPEEDHGDQNMDWPRCYTHREI